jgi:hypothetical protein
MTVFQAIATGLALSYLTIVVWYAARLAWRHSEPRSFVSLTRLRRTNPKKFRDAVWISRINGAMCSAMSLGFTIAAPLVAIFGEEGRWYALIPTLFAPPMLYLVLRWWFWGLRTAPG